MINAGVSENRPEATISKTTPAPSFEINEDALIRAKMPMALSMAAKLAWQWRINWIDYHDIAQEGLIGYLRAMRRYAENPGDASLNTYAMKRMIGAMIDSVTDPYREENKNKRIPNFAICDLDDALDIAGDDGRKWSDGIAIKQLYSAFQSLPEQQRDVMRLLYVDDLTMLEAGNKIGVTESRVSQIHKAAIKKLREKYGH